MSYSFKKDVAKTSIRGSCFPSSSADGLVISIRNIVPSTFSDIKQRFYRSFPLLRLRKSNDEFTNDSNAMASALDEIGGGTPEVDTYLPLECKKFNSRANQRAAFGRPVVKRARGYLIHCRTYRSCARGTGLLYLKRRSGFQ